MRPHVCLVSVLLLLLACDKPRVDVTIALATGASGLADIRLAQSLVDAEGPSGITFIIDTVRSGTDTETELARAHEFLQVENLVGVVGHPGSRASLVAAPLYNEAGVVQVVPTGTSRSLANAGPFTFVLAPNDSIEGATIGRFALDTLGARRATVFFLTDEYGYGLRDGVLAELEKEGAEVLDAVPMRPSYQLAESREGDLDVLVEAAMERGEPDVVVLAVRDYATRIIVPLVAARYPDVRFVAGDGVLLSGENREALASHVDRLYLTVFWNPGPEDVLPGSFAEDYRQATGAYPTHDHALFRDGLMLLTAAVNEVGAERDEIRDYLLSLGDGRPPFQGVTGPISFGPNRAHSVFVVRADHLPVR